MAPGSDPATLLKTILAAHPKGIGVTALSRKAHIHRNMAAKYLEVLLASGQVEMQKVGMTKLFVLKETAPLRTQLTYEKELEEKNRQLERDIAFFTRKAYELANLSPDADIYQWVCDGALVLVPDAVISYSSYDPETCSLTVRTIAGDRNNILEKYFPRSIGLNTPVTDPESLLIMRGGSLFKVPGGLHVATYGQIPPMVCSRIEKEIHWISTYAIGFTAEGQVLGALVLLKCGEGEIERPDTLIAYARLSALAVQNWLDRQNITDR
jgi:hypothetical protein